MRVLVTEELSPQGLELLRKDFQVDVRTDLAKGDLVAEIAPYDALVIRSATQVTAEVLDAATNLRVVARAGHLSRMHPAIPGRRSHPACGHREEDDRPGRGGRAPGLPRDSWLVTQDDAAAGLGRDQLRQPRRPHNPRLGRRSKEATEILI